MQHWMMAYTFAKHSGGTGNGRVFFDTNDGKLTEDDIVGLEGIVKASNGFATVAAVAITRLDQSR